MLGNRSRRTLDSSLAVAFCRLNRDTNDYVTRNVEEDIRQMMRIQRAHIYIIETQQDYRRDRCPTVTFLHYCRWLWR